MEKKHGMMLFGLFAFLLILQLSCSTTKGNLDESSPPEVAETGIDELLLAERHKASGIGCVDCHKSAQPESGVTKETCVGCHENYKELGDPYISPHNAHVLSSGCEDCHHAHKPSEMMCQGCHLFDIEIP